MAEELQNRKRNVVTGETWEKAFKGVDKTSQAFRDLVEEFTAWVSDYHEFTSYQEGQFADYIKSLDSIQNHWKDINSWVEKNSDTLRTYTGSLTDIQSVLQSIVDETGGFTRKTRDGINLFRQLNRIASDGISITQQEGGISESALKSLDRRKTKLDVIYKSHLRQLGVLDAEGKVDDDLAQAQFKRSADQVKSNQDRLDKLNRLKANGSRIDARQIRYLEDQIRYHQVIMELVGKETRTVKDSLDEQLSRQKELFRLQSAGKGPVEDLGRNAFGDRKVNIVSKILKKLQFQEEAEDIQRTHGEWKTDRVVARQAVDIEGKKKDEAIERANRAKNIYKDLADKDSYGRKLSKERISSIETKKSDLASLLEEQSRQKELFETGKQPNGQSVSWLEQNAAFEKYDELEKQIKKVRREISNLTEEQNQYFKELDNARIGYQNLLKEAKDAEESYQKTVNNWEQVQNSKFDVVLKEKIKGIFADLSGLIAKIGALLGVLVWRQLLKFDEEAVKTKRVIGQWADASALANTKFVTGTEVLKTMRDLGEQFHINPVQVFSGEELGRIAQAQKLTGMSAQAAGNLGVQSKIIGKNANTYRDSIAAGANQANRLNHSAVNLSAVQNDVLTTSRAITLSYGKNTEALAKAAGSAAALGMNLQDVENISRNLMNFESSIKSEMQAQLLTGMQLNLAKAREYALNNDLNGVAQEISRQGMDAAKFSHMNYIQQENMAKALGMSREQMSKMLIMQEINRGLTAKQVAAMTGMRKEDVEALSAQEKWQTMKQRFLESLVPLLEPVLQVTSDILKLVNPLVGLIGKIAGWISRIISIIPENSVVLRTLWTLALGIGTVIAVNWFRGLRGAALLGTRLGGIFKGIGTSIVNIGKGIGNWVKGLRGASTASQALNTAGMVRGRSGRLHSPEVVARARNIRRFQSMPAPSPAAATGTSRLGGAFSSLGKNILKIAIGAAAMGIMSLALIGIAKALQMLRGVEWKQFGIMAASIGLLVGTMVALGAIMMSGVGAALLGGGMLALGMLAVGMIAVGAALDSLGKGLRSLPAGDELSSVSVGIRAIAGSVGELTVKLKDLQPKKLRALGRAFKNLKGAGIQIQTPVRETEEVVSQVSRASENTGESQGIRKETIEAAAQSIVIKQAQVQASAQQISIEQKATDLSKIEQKIDRVVKAVVESRPDWNWLEFNRAYSTNAL